MATRDVQPTDAYADKLLKLLPAEVTAAYLAIRSVVDLTTAGQPPNPADPDKLPAFIILGVIVLLTVGTPIFLQLMDLISRNSQRIFMALSFFVWAINIDYPQMLKILPFDRLLMYLIPISLILWAGLALPVYIYRVSKPT
jgi:hypothetical protein